MAQIKKNDFVEVTYTGTIKEGGIIFDTTDGALAKEQGIHNENMEYGPVVVCVGKEQVIKGLDKSLEGKEPNQEYEVQISPEDAFGKKDAKKIQLIPTNKFLKENIQPVPGLQVSVDNAFGTIKTVSGGRTLVDFNHPLAGKDIVYKVKINKLVDDQNEQIKALVKMKLNMSDIKAEVKENSAVITAPIEFPKEVQSELKKEIKEVVKVKDIKFTTKKEPKESKGQQ